MTMKLLALLAPLALVASLAAAQETATEPAAEPAAGEAQQESAVGELSMGTVEGEGGAGQQYVAETHGDWQLNCIKTEDGNDPCQLYQLLKDADGNSVAEVNMIALPPGQEAVAGATLVTPLETLLSENIRIGVDGGKNKVYPFTFCAAIGCVARVGFTAEEIEQFKSGSKATLTIVPLAAPDKTVVLDLSLKGFTAGFEAVAARNIAKSE
jgi:invasion protein IalB